MKNKKTIKIVIIATVFVGVLLGFKYRAEAAYYINKIKYPQYVATENGKVSILDLKVGDRVIGYNAHAQTPSVNTIEKVDFHIQTGKFYIFNGDLVLFENQTI